MKISRLVEVVRRLDELDPGNLAGRPDSSGIRGQGLKREPDRRLGNFPYDRDTFYGQPVGYDRGSSNVGNLNGPLIPHDDSEFSLKLMNLESEDVDEAINTPYFMGKANSTGGGSTLAGVSGWANNPPKDWEEGEFSESILNTLNIDTSPPETEEVPNSHLPDFHYQTDDDMENRLDRIWGREDNLNFVDPNMFASPDSHVIAPDPWSVVNTRLTSRGLYGLMPKESAWDRVTGMTLNKREIS